MVRGERGGERGDGEGGDQKAAPPAHYLMGHHPSKSTNPTNEHQRSYFLLPRFMCIESILGLTSRIHIGSTQNKCFFIFLRFQRLFRKSSNALYGLLLFAKK